MKRITALILALALMLAAVPALAEAKLDIIRESLQIYKPYVFLYLKVENTGDEPVEISSNLDLFDTDDELFWAGEYIALGDVLQPGESAYAYFCVYLYGDTNLGRYTSEVEGVSASGLYSTVRYASQAELVPEDADHDETCILIAFTNTTDETVFSLYASGILLDEDGEIVYLSIPVLYDLGVTPGSTVIFRCEIPPYVVKELDLEHLTVDSTVYTSDFE